MDSGLKEFGLNSYEAEAYTTLVRIGISTSTVIAKESGVPYGKIYPVLYSLQKKGYVKLYEGRPKRFMAIEPRIILNDEIEKKRRKFTNLKRNVNQLINAIERIEKPEKIIENIQIIEGRKNFLNLSIKLHKKAKKRYRSISSIPLYKPHLEAYREMCARGVKARVITPQTNKEKIKIWNKLGIRLKYFKEIEIRFTVIDKTDFVVKIGESDRSGYVALWIQNPALANILANHFDKLWNRAKDI